MRTRVKGLGNRRRENNKLSFLLLLLTLIFSLNSFAEEKGVGLGVILGEPTGLSFKAWMQSRTAIDLVVAWSLEGKDTLHFHGDYLYHDFDFIKVEKGKFCVYYGLGARIKSDKKARFGTRIPLGISYMLEKAPLDIFFELGPILDLTPSTEFEMSGGVGLRYYFE